MRKQTIDRLRQLQPFTSSRCNDRRQSKLFNKPFTHSLVTGLCLLLFAGCSFAKTTKEQDKAYRLNYTFEIIPEKKQAHVTIELPDARLIDELNFNLKDKIHSNVKANGQLELKDGRAVWQPPKKNAKLSLDVNLEHKRNSGSYDAYVAKDWAIFRGDDLVPAARTRTAKGAYAEAILTFKLPKDWPHVNVGWPKIEPGKFRIDNPERQFDRPVGWIIAGNLGTRREFLGSEHKTRVSVSAPRGSDLHRMDVLTFLTIVWPEAEKAFRTRLPELLIVGAGDPMWLGGLSSPNSFFLHEKRPLVSENGTSAVLHEMGHVLSGIIGAKNDDWIAEGLIEFYSVELLYRAGAMTEERRTVAFDKLMDWGKDVKTLKKKHARGAVTARAAVLFEQLDKELRSKSEHDIDDITHALMKEKKASTKTLINTCKKLLKKPCKTLKTKLIAE
ncbi:hypothetical protein TDB9533_02923 [Thalassocella blandensis]|nr:hypothetical protein TDB9533_02923 [Thalassocella blandensis]